MLPFACYLDPEGNIWMTPGPVIAYHATTAVFQIGSGGQAVVPFAGEAFTPAAGSGAAYLGGNGTNVEAEAGTPLGTMVPYGRFRATAEDTWTAEGFPDLVLTFDAGTGGAEISDGTNVVADLPAASATIAPYGTFTATAYGETTYNAGNPWTVDLAYEGAADTWPARVAAVVWTDAATAQAGLWNRTGWQTWESADDPAWTLTLDGTGAGEISDGTDVVATRAASADRLHDPSGQWESTAYGEANYGTEAFLGRASLARGVPAAGVLYVELTVDGTTDEVTAAAGPFWAAALPANTATEFYVPILESDGAGLVEQVQLGPIHWRPAP